MVDQLLDMEKMYQNLTTLITDSLGSLFSPPLPSETSISSTTPALSLLSLLAFAVPFPVQLSKLVVLLFGVSVVCILVARRLSRWKVTYNVALRALRHGGPIPKHVAFIMDGNRRWARRLGLPASQGHPKGGEKLIESLQWCLEAGVETVTVFAFSIENFKRSQSEVSEIMSLAERTFDRFMNQQHILHKRRVRVRFLGDMSFISPSLRRMMARLMVESVQYTDGPTLNICFAYAARHDMASAITDVVNCTVPQEQQSQSQTGTKLNAEDINADFIAAFLASGTAKGAGDLKSLRPQHSFYPDLLVRTSGETRLSDFLLWESSQCILSFYPAMWPELSVWDFVKIVLKYQRNVRLRNKYYAPLAFSGARKNSTLRIGDSYTKLEKEATKPVGSRAGRLGDIIMKSRQAHNKLITSYDRPHNVWKK